MSKEKDQSFENGIIYAIARLIELYDQVEAGISLLNESGINVYESSADEYDLHIVIGAIRRGSNWGGSCD